MKVAGLQAAGGPKPETPACDAMRAIGQWNSAWDPFYELSPRWTDQFFAFGGSIYKSGILTARFLELMSIALDASVTHMYAPGTRRHIKAALAAGATPEEIMTVLQICVSVGLESCLRGAALLAEELERSPFDLTTDPRPWCESRPHQNAWLEAVHALQASPEHTRHMTTEELIALARCHRFQPRPEASLERVEENLRAMLDMLVLVFDYEREPTSTPALVARRLATIVADLEDTRGHKSVH
jgi:alkylhydroperoxidase/carboxymuconolactone decarboxylase family protein YurZ